MIIAALVSAFAVIAGAITIQKSLESRRRNALRRLELKPNCLLTRHPIAFLAGQRSLFHLGRHWHSIPAFLREHGYDVMLIEPPHGRDRTKAILKALDELESPCHVIADSSQESELKALARARHGNVATLTQIENPVRARKSLDGDQRFSAADLRPLESAIATFEVPPLTSARLDDVANRFSALLLRLHNLLSQSRDSLVDPWETGAFFTQPEWANESRFLDLAISLAERDAQWCD
jgi:hypothetical protein